MQEHKRLGLQYLPFINLLFGVAAIFLLLQTRKESTTVLFGYSPSRLILIVVETAALILFLGISIRVVQEENTAKRLTEALANLPLSSHALLAVVIFFLIGCAGLLGIAILDRWDQLGSLGTWIWQVTPFLLWPGSIAPQIFFYHHGTRGWNWDKNTIWSLVITNAFLVFIVLDALMRTQGFTGKRLQLLARDEILPGLIWPAIVLLVLFISINFLRNIPVIPRPVFVSVRNALLVFTAAISLYTLSATVVGHYDTGEQAYSPYLARALLQGKAYLEDPVSTLDLTSSNGHWYVPYPPLVAILMMPQVALIGTEAVNTVSFSVFYASLNTALVFLILEKLRHLHWTNTSLGSNIWLTALFAFGTVHWYLAIWGEVWPLNQLTATTFIAIAVLVALGGGPAWLAGFSLGVAMLARPHVGLTYPVLLGIYSQSLSPLSFSSQWKKLFRWLLVSGLALSIPVMGILGYNNLRFGSPFDFGYDAAQINIGLFTDQLRTYGQFHVHFIWRNIQVMFFGLPHWNAQCSFFSANEVGMSVFITTPALLYVFRTRKLNPLTLGAMVSVGLFLIVLLLHYSTGAMQFGYRFLLDFLIPLLILLAAAWPGEKLSLTSKILILLGILVNYWGLWWFFRHWCR